MDLVLTKQPVRLIRVANVQHTHMKIQIWPRMCGVEEWIVGRGYPLWALRDTAYFLGMP